MSAEKIQAEEREFTIPLRKEWRKIANYRRAGRAAKSIKKSIARHMKVPDRDISKVKLDIYLNNEIWFRGKTKPPAKIKVIAKKENDLVKVSLKELPEKWAFHKKRREKFHKPSEKPAEEKEEEKKEEKTEEQKKDESEKEKSVAEQHAKEAKQDSKAQKHTTKVKEPTYHRVALKK